MKAQQIQHLLDQMWQDYLQLNPQAQKIKKLFERQGEKVVNDHIALRTYDIDQISIGKLSRPFLEVGYVKGGEYYFEQKKLFAEHFEHSSGELPKIFISQLLVEQFAVPIQQQIKSLVEQMDEQLLQRKDFLYSGRPWELNSLEYQKLAKVSEYAAWVAAFGFRPNHFTISINEL